MDANYWSGMQASNRANVPVPNVVDLNQSGIMPYGGVEVIPAASLELLMNQQRLAGVSGMSVRPMTTGCRRAAGHYFYCYVGIFYCIYIG